MITKKLSRVIAIYLIVFLTACSGSAGNSYYKTGNKFMEKGQYEEALNSYEEAIKKNSERAEFYIAAGFANIGLEKYEDAINTFDKGYSPKDNQIVRENNKFLFRGKGIAYLKLGKYPEALLQFASASAIREASSLDNDLKKYIALTEIKLGDYKSAADVYEEMLRVKNPDVSLYGKLAEVYFAMGEAVKAVENYDLAISKEPDNFDAYFGKYEILSARGEKEQAAEVLNKAAGIKITNDISGYKAGILEYLRGNKDKAKEYLNTAYTKGILESSYYLAKISMLENDYTGAKAFFEKYEQELGKVTISGWYDGMAECLIKEEKYEDALNYVLKGLALEDVSAMKQLMLKKVTLYEQTVDYNKAYEAAVEYTKLYPEDKKMAREVVFLSTRKTK